MFCDLLMTNANCSLQPATHIYTQTRPKTLAETKPVHRFIATFENKSHGLWVQVQMDGYDNRRGQAERMSTYYLGGQGSSAFAQDFVEFST
jgi:hypothetical protein